MHLSDYKKSVGCTDCSKRGQYCSNKMLSHDDNIQWYFYLAFNNVNVLCMTPTKINKLLGLLICSL